MVLKEKLQNTKMGNEESVSSYVTRLGQVKDELAAVGETVDGTKLVKIALNGFSKSWDVFVRGIVAREHTPDWDRLWDNFMQEEPRLASLSGSSSHHNGEEEENIALARKGKAKTKKGSGSGQTYKGEKKHDMSKVKCFSCHKPEHYASQFPNKKKDKKKSQTAASTDIDEFSSRFDEDFLLIACLSISSTRATRVWYIDSGASYHMTGLRKYFSSFREEEMNFDMEMGNKSKCTPVGRGIVTIQRESGKTFNFTNVLYVPGMTKNLISVSAHQDRGYDVSFRGPKVYIQPRGSKQAKMVGIESRKLYRLQFESPQALINSSKEMGVVA
jgi:hypothetical protein